MSTADGLLIVLFLALFLAPAPLLGRFFYRALEGERTWLTPVLAPLERVGYRLGGVDSHHEQSWQQYALALLMFNLVGLLALFLMLLLQAYLPLNP